MSSGIDAVPLMPCWVAKEKCRCNGKGAKMGCDQNTESNFKLGPVLLHQLAGRTGGGEDTCF